MSFARIKRIKGTEYAYIVENRWKKRGKKGARQKVSGYLGRVIKPSKVLQKDFFLHHNIRNKEEYAKNDVRKIVTDLAIVELLNHGFNMDGKKLSLKHEIGKTVFDSSNFTFNVDGKEKKLALSINEGFLCKETLHKITMGKFYGDEKEVGLKLAKSFVEAGLNIPAELFVSVFEKVISRYD